MFLEFVAGGIILRFRVYIGTNICNVPRGGNVVWWWKFEGIYVLVQSAIRSYWIVRGQFGGNFLDVVNCVHFHQGNGLRAYLEGFLRSEVPTLEGKVSIFWGKSGEQIAVFFFGLVRCGCFLS